MAIVLRLINEGLIQEKIANELDIESSHVAYYIKKAKRMGYVKSTIKDVVVILELTQAGKNFLDQYEKSRNSSSSSLHICRLEINGMIYQIYMGCAIRMRYTML